jgi:hypothetical protein
LAFLWTRRRRENEPQAATVPVASAPVVPPLWHAGFWPSARDAASPQDPRGARRAAGPAISPPDSHRAWTAEIEWRHTDAESRFCVIARTAQGAGETTVAQSPPLKWPPTGPASVQALTDAAESLETSLEAARWKAIPPGRAWYSKRFAWEPVVFAAGAERDEATPVEPTSASDRHTRPRRLVLAVATGSLLVGTVAIAGLLAAGGDAPPAVDTATGTTQIAEAGVRLQVPKGWTRDAATVLGFTHPVRLRNTGEGLRAAVERLPAVSPTLLPAAFLQTLKSAPERPDTVRLRSGHDAWRYLFPFQGKTQLVLYAAPTTTGIATIACLGPNEAGVPRGCESLASAITVPGSLPLEPGSSAAFYSRLPDAVRDLDAARNKGTRELLAATRAIDQAAAADRLSREHLAAEAVLAPLAAEGNGLPTATVGALSATAGAYESLASAARARSPQSYADASRAVTGANADLRRTLTKVAAASSAASRAATRAATAPVPTPAAGTRPAASTSKGIDLSLLPLAAFGLFIIGLAIGQIVRVLRDDAPGGLQNALR